MQISWPYCVILPNFMRLRKLGSLCYGAIWLAGKRADFFQHRLLAAPALDLQRGLEIALAIEAATRPAGGLSSEGRVMALILGESVPLKHPQWQLFGPTLSLRIWPQWDWPRSQTASPKLPVPLKTGIHQSAEMGRQFLGWNPGMVCGLFLCWFSFLL